MSDSTSLVPVDTTNAVAVSDYLDRAREWLATAVEMTGPAQIAAAKAEVATAAEATKRFNLSKGIQQDAQEMVRRAEYALGKSIRKGQAEGTIRTRLDGPLARNVLHAQGMKKPGPTDFASQTELSGHGKAGIYALADGVESEQFETALTAAKAEGNLSRTNVVRKVKQQGSGPPNRQQRADLIRELAAQNYTSGQMPNKVGVTEQTVRLIAREFDIDIPADRAVGKTRRIDSTNVVVQTATALEGLVMGVELIDYAAVDPTEASQWVDSVSNSLRVLNRFHKKIKETTQ